MPQSSSTLSLAYRTSYLPSYDPENELCHENDDDEKNERKLSKKQKEQAKNWNTYQKNTWYQTHLNKLEREDCPVGVQGEFRTPGLAETKVHLMESGKWKTFIEKTQNPKTKNQSFLNSQSLLNDQEFYATTTPTPSSSSLHELEKSYRPHSSSSSSSYKSTSNSMNGMRLSGGHTLPINNQTNRRSQEGSTPVINPKTMFLPKTPKPVFGTLKQSTQLFTTSTPPQSGTSATVSRPNTTNSVRWNDQKDFGEINLLNSTQLSSDQTSSRPRPEVRLMSSQALSRRHMGVSIDPLYNTKNEEPYHTKMKTLKDSNQLNHRPFDQSDSNSFTMPTLLGRTATHPHPQSGYDRGLKGTLLIDEWRKDELMKSDGKICYHPLSYDVLETLTFGPPDPSKKHSHDKIFVSSLLPPPPLTLLAASSTISSRKSHPTNLLMPRQSCFLFEYQVVLIKDDHNRSFPPILRPLLPPCRGFPSCHH